MPRRWKNRRDHNGSIIIVVIACVVVIVSIGLFVIGYGAVLGLQKSNLTAAEAAALMAADEMSMLAIKYPRVGLVGVTSFDPYSSWHPARRADLNPEIADPNATTYVPHPVWGANDLLAAARSQLQLAVYTGNQAAIDHAKARLSDCLAAVKQLNVHVRDKVGPGEAIYKHALEVYNSNPSALAGIAEQKDNAFAVIPGRLISGGTSFVMPFKADGGGDIDGKYLRTYTPISVPSVSGSAVQFAPIALHSSLVNNSNFTTAVGADPQVALTVVRVGIVKRTKTSSFKDNLVTSACAVTGGAARSSSGINSHYLRPATGLTVSFSGGIPLRSDQTGNVSLWDFLNNDTLKTKVSAPQAPPPSEFPADRPCWFKANGTNVPSQINKNTQGAIVDGKSPEGDLVVSAPPRAGTPNKANQNLSDAMAIAVVDWVFSADDRVDPDDIRTALQTQLSDPDHLSKYEKDGSRVTKAPLLYTVPDSNGRYVNYDGRYVSLNNAFHDLDKDNLVKFDEKNRFNSFFSAFGFKGAGTYSNAGNNATLVTYRPQTGNWVNAAYPANAPSTDMPLGVLCDLQDAMYRQPTASTIVADVGLEICKLTGTSPYDSLANPSDIAENNNPFNPANPWLRNAWQHAANPTANPPEFGGAFEAQQALSSTDNPEFWWLFTSKTNNPAPLEEDPRSKGPYFAKPPDAFIKGNTYIPGAGSTCFINGYVPNDSRTVRAISSAIASTLNLGGKDFYDPPLLAGNPTTVGGGDASLDSKGRHTQAWYLWHPNENPDTSTIFQNAGLAYWNVRALSEIAYIASYMAVNGHNKYDEANTILSLLPELTSEGVTKGTDQDAKDPNGPRATYYEFPALAHQNKNPRVYPFTNIRLMPWLTGFDAERESERSWASDIPASMGLLSTDVSNDDARRAAKLEVNDCYIPEADEIDLVRNKLVPFFFYAGGQPVGQPDMGIPEYWNLGTVDFYPGSNTSLNLARKIFAQNGGVNSENYKHLTDSSTWKEHSLAPGVKWPYISGRFGAHRYFLQTLTQLEYPLNTSNDFQEWNSQDMGLDYCGTKSGFYPSGTLGSPLTKFLNQAIYTMNYTNTADGNFNAIGNAKTTGAPHAVYGNDPPAPAQAGQQSGTAPPQVPYGVVFYFLPTGDRSEGNGNGEICISRYTPDFSIDSVKFPNSYMYCGDQLLNGQNLYAALNGLETQGQDGGLSFWSVTMLHNLADLTAGSGMANAAVRCIPGSQLNPNFPGRNAAQGEPPVAADLSGPGNILQYPGSPTSYNPDPQFEAYIPDTTSRLPVQGLHIHIGAPIPMSCCNQMCRPISAPFAQSYNPTFKLNPTDPTVHFTGGHKWCDNGTCSGNDPNATYTYTYTDLDGVQHSDLRFKRRAKLGIDDGQPVSGQVTNGAPNLANGNFLYTTGFQKLPDDKHPNACSPAPADFIYW